MPVRRRKRMLDGEYNPMEDYVVSGDSMDEITFGDSMDEIIIGDTIQDMVESGYGPDGMSGGRYVQTLQGLGYVDRYGDMWELDGFGSWVKRAAGTVSRVATRSVKSTAGAVSKVVRSPIVKSVAKVAAEGVATSFGAPPGAASRAVDRTWKTGDTLSKIAHSTGSLIKRTISPPRPAPAPRPAPIPRPIPTLRPAPTTYSTTYSPMPSIYDKIRSRMAQVRTQPTPQPVPRVSTNEDMIKKYLPIGLALIVGAYFLTRKR